MNAWPVTGMDRALTFAAVLGLGLLIAVTIWAWPQLPPVVPIHFGWDGRADGWGDRGLLLIMPGLGLAMYAAFSVLVRVPHIYNYPWPITEQNRDRQFLLARRMMLVLRAVIVLGLMASFLATALVALGTQQGLPRWLAPAILGAIGAVLGSYLVAAWRAR